MNKKITTQTQKANRPKGYRGCKGSLPLPLPAEGPSESPRRAVKIYDTTLRDGAQSVGVSFSLEDKLRMARALDDLGVHYIEGGWPGSNPKAIAFFKEAGKMRFKNARMTSLKYISHLTAEVSNQPAPANLPFVGSHAFAHKGGIHVSAVNKAPATYEHIVPGCVGNKRFVSISELSGKSNILARAHDMGLKVDKKSPDVQRIVQRVKELESKGYHFEDAEGSFELLSKSLLGKLKTYFTLYGYRVMIWKNAEDETWAEATIKAAVPNHETGTTKTPDTEEHTSAGGKGPVEALDNALRKVLEKFYPALKEVKLMDYKVRILNETDGTAAVTRVHIHSKDKKRKWGTVGVSDNIIDASWQALTDAYIYKLKKDEENQEKAR